MSQSIPGPGEIVRPPNLQVPADIMSDLEASGLQPSDMKIRALGDSERAAVGCTAGTRGYVIPYFAFNGNGLPFYRVKVINPLDNVKYRQLRKSPNHIYFPLGLKDCLHAWMRKYPKTPVIVITEGEKKAACAVKFGIPAIGLGGVDSWRSRTLILPRDTEVSSTKNSVKAKIPASHHNIPELLQLAEGFGDFIDTVTQYNLTPVIIYDSDRGGTIKADVQRAATTLAYELRHLGIPSSRIKQVILPDIYEGAPNSKTGMDDLLVKFGPPGAEVFKEWIIEAFDDPTKFPRHPNPRGYIATQLDLAPRRKESQQIASVILAELDATGMRYREKNVGTPFYYDRLTHKLVPASLLTRSGEVLHESKFGTLLYQKFGVTGVDGKVLSFLASQFMGENPIKEVTPRRVKCLITENEDPSNPHGIAVQTSDSTFISVSSSRVNPVELHVNGDLGILFEQDQVDPVDVDRVMEYFLEYNNERVLEPWWLKVLEDTNMGKTLVPANIKERAEQYEANLKEIDKEVDAELVEQAISTTGKDMRTYACLLFYISPFLSRWRGLQLPVEVTIGEAGSGKSSVYEMRQTILTGRPHLRNLPSDPRDFVASVTNSGGLHVVDNVHFSNRAIKAYISDEVCRLITEPNPTVEMRKLFTTAELVRMPVDVSFCFTAVQQPFQNADLFSRAAIFHTCRLGKLPDGSWVDKQIDEFGGRESWLAHQLVFLHRFLALSERMWNENYKTEHRLAHFEQALEIAGKVLGVPTGFLKKTVTEVQHSALEDADWTLQGIKAFIDEVMQSENPYKKFSAKEIAEWGMGSEDFHENTMMLSSRKLGRYISQHYSILSTMTHMVLVGVQGNKQVYRIRPEIVNISRRSKSQE